MKLDDIDSFYKKDFDIWLKKISLVATNNEDALIPADYFNVIPNENKKNVIVLLVFYNFLIHLYMHHYFGANYYRDYVELVPYKNIRNTYGYVDPFQYINIPIQKKHIKENNIKNMTENVFTVCVTNTVSYFKRFPTFNYEELFSKLLREPEFQNDRFRYLMVCLEVVVHKIAHYG